MSEVNQINAIKHLVEVNQYFKLNSSLYTNLRFILYHQHYHYHHNHPHPSHPQYHSSLTNLSDY